jgi:hypothetical protein
MARWHVAVALTAAFSSAPVHAQDRADVIAELPRVLLNTRAPVAPAPGRKVIAVGSGGNFQAALNAAQPGDVIELAKGATFTGNFILPAKKTATPAWIVVRPSNHEQLPVEGVRITPSIAAELALPKILSPNANYALATELGAHHYRITGINVGVVASNPQSWGLVALDGGEKQTSLAVVPHDIVLDHMYIHGSATLTLRRCVVLNSASSAVVDSWLSDCHEKGADSQAIAGWNGPGPFKIVNNYLEGAGENLMFGGGDPAIPNLVPTDIEIRRNHIFKPVSWKPLWTVKNLLELKNAQRVLIEGNILENNWANGQSGTGVLIKSVNQSGGCKWCLSRDVTFRQNLIRNVGGAFNISGADGNAEVTTHARSITVTDNVVSNINVEPFDGTGRGFELIGDPTNVVIAHNTLMTPRAIAWLGSSLVGLSIHDNILGGSEYGVMSDGYAGGTALAKVAPGAYFTRNIILTPGVSAAYPPGNFFPATVRHIGFEEIAAENFRLIRISPYEKAGTDKKDIGADIPLLEAATKGVRVSP